MRGSREAVKLGEHDGECKTVVCSERHVRYLASAVPKLQYMILKVAAVQALEEGLLKDANLSGIALDIGGASISV
jgi:hypothetical protein